MSDKITNINQLMNQMQSLQTQAQSGVTNPTEVVQGVNNPDALGFGDMLKGSIEEVNSQMVKSGAMKEAFTKGDPDVSLTEVMVQAQKASVSFQAMLQVRNKLVEAYKDVINTPL